MVNSDLGWSNKDQASTVSAVVLTEESDLCTASFANKAHSTAPWHLWLGLLCAEGASASSVFFYFVLQLNFILLTSCLCHISRKESLVLFACQLLRSHCAQYTVLVTVPSFSQWESDVRCAHTSHISVSLRMLSRQGWSLATQASLGWAGHWGHDIQSSSISTIFLQRHFMHSCLLTPLR